MVKKDNMITIGILAVIGVVMFLMYSIIRNYGIELFTFDPSSLLDFSFSTVAALVVAAITFVYTGRALKGSKIESKPTLIASAIIAIIAFIATKNFLISGIAIAIVVLALYSAVKIFVPKKNG